MDSSKSESTRKRKSDAAKTRSRGSEIIRLDDLIPKQDVKGGRQRLFGSRLSNSKGKRKEA